MPFSRNCIWGKDGKFPSGKTEDDALLHVLSRAQTTINLDQEEDDDDDEDNNSTSSEFTTPYMACFILFGPYSKKWGPDIVELFSVDTAAIDAKAKKLKAEKKKTIEIDMDETKDNILLILFNILSLTSFLQYQF